MLKTQSLIPNYHPQMVIISHVPNAIIFLVYVLKLLKQKLCNFFVGSESIHRILLLAKKLQFLIFCNDQSLIWSFKHYTQVLLESLWFLQQIIALGQWLSFGTFYTKLNTFTIKIPFTLSRGLKWKFWFISPLTLGVD